MEGCAVVVLIRAIRVEWGQRGGSDLLVHCTTPFQINRASTAPANSEALRTIRSFQPSEPPAIVLQDSEPVVEVVWCDVVMVLPLWLIKVPSLR